MVHILFGLCNVMQCHNVFEGIGVKMNRPKYCIRCDERIILVYLTNSLGVCGEKSDRIIFHPEIPERHDTVCTASTQYVRLNWMLSDTSQANL